MVLQKSERPPTRLLNVSAMGRKRIFAPGIFVNPVGRAGREKDGRFIVDDCTIC